MKSNPEQIIFPNLPFNHTRIYTVAYTHGGCSVYLPALTNEEALKTKAQVQEFLDSQITPTLIIA